MCGLFEERHKFHCAVPQGIATDFAQWRNQHETLTAQLIAIEEEINDRTNRLFNLTPTEIKTLHEFQQGTKTFYPLGEV